MTNSGGVQTMGLLLVASCVQLTRTAYTASASPAAASPTTTTSTALFTTKFSFAGGGKCVGLGGLSASVDTMAAADLAAVTCPGSSGAVAARNTSWVDVGNGWCRQRFEPS